MYRRFMRFALMITACLLSLRLALAKSPPGKQPNAKDGYTPRQPAKQQLPELRLALGGTPEERRSERVFAGRRG